MRPYTHPTKAFFPHSLHNFPDLAESRCCGRLWDLSNAVASGGVLWAFQLSKGFPHLSVELSVGTEFEDQTVVEVAVRMSILLMVLP